MKMKFPADTRILYLEEYLKRLTKMAATEAVYLFRKDKRLLMTPSKTLGDYARAATPDEIKDGNPKGERVLILIVRKTDNF